MSMPVKTIAPDCRMFVTVSNPADALFRKFHTPKQTIAMLAITRMPQQTIPNSGTTDRGFSTPYSMTLGRSCIVFRSDSTPSSTGRQDSSGRGRTAGDHVNQLPDVTFQIFEGMTVHES